VWGFSLANNEHRNKLSPNLCTDVPHETSEPTFSGIDGYQGTQLVHMSDLAKGFNHMCGKGMGPETTPSWKNFFLRKAI
jgi:hypothetical protein